MVDWSDDDKKRLQGSIQVGGIVKLTSAEDTTRTWTDSEGNAGKIHGR